MFDEAVLSMKKFRVKPSATTVIKFRIAKLPKKAIKIFQREIGRDKTTKIVLGVFSGILHLALLFAIINWYGDFLNKNFILTVVLTFLVQYIYWEIIRQLKVLKYR